MEYNSLKLHLYDMNEDELFYKRYYYARQQKYSLEEFLASLDMDEVHRRNLLITELPETIPPEFLDSYFFDMSNPASIVVQKHNRYAPALTHHHTFFEMAYIYDGTCVHRINDKDLVLSTGDLIVIPPDTDHSVSAFSDDTIMFNVMLRKDTLRVILYNFMNTRNVLSSFFMDNIYARHANDYILFQTGQDLPMQEAFIRMYWESINKEKYYYQAITHTLTLCLFLLIRNYERSVIMPRFASRTDSQGYGIIQFIRRNYKNISLKKVSEKFNYSPEHISRLIKSSTGMTYSQLLTKIRMDEACNLLSATNMTVSAISASLGFLNQEHFIRKFKKYANMTPTAYRKLHPTMEQAPGALT